MEKRQIMMQDGRYLIFYTFTDEPAMSHAEEKHTGAISDKDPEAKPEAEEERRV